MQLIQTKEIENISVSDICKISKLNRSTFYSNYIDIYDLAEKVKQQMEVEFAQFQLSNNAKQNPDGYLNMFRYIKDNQIYLTKTEYAILKQLLLNPKQVVTKSKILDLISMDTLDCDENSLKVHISNIRKKIKKVTDTEYIEAVWGIGYKIYE